MTIPHPWADAVRKARRIPGWPEPGIPIAVAVSGGPHSVALADLLRREGSHPLELVHVDHGMRPDSDEDARLVADLGRTWGIAVRSTRLASPPTSETTAREARRLAIRALMADSPALRFLAIGHHRSDQAETLLWRMVRGTSGDGLAGMAVVSEGPDSTRLLRPFLSLPGAALTAWCDREGLPYRIDPSNLDPAWTPRNTLRLQVAPIFDRLNSGWEEAFHRLARRQTEDRAALEGWARSVLAGSLETPDRLNLPPDLPVAVQRRVVALWQPRWDTARHERVVAWMGEGSPGHLHVAGRIVGRDGPAITLLATGAETLVSCRLCLTRTPAGPSMPEGCPTPSPGIPEALM